MKCPNGCVEEMEWNRTRIEFDKMGVDVEAYMCPVCGYAEANTY